MTEMFPGSGFHVGCAVHHTDGEGNTIPCPGHPHAEAPPGFPYFGAEDCPHCDEPQPDLQMDAHVSSAHAGLPPCTARIEPDHGGLYTCAFRVGHKGGEYGDWHASTRGEAEVSGRYVWNDTAKGATPHQPPEQSDAADACMHSEGYEGECPCVSGCGCCKVAAAYPRAEEGRPEPPSDEELNSVLPVQPDPRQPAYDAVYEYIRALGDYLPPDPVHRNAVIWRAVQAALEATPVGRCISSHCVEGGHILPVEGEPS